MQYEGLSERKRWYVRDEVAWECIPTVTRRVWGIHAMYLYSRRPPCLASRARPFLVSQIHSLFSDCEIDV